MHNTVAFPAKWCSTRLERSSLNEKKTVMYFAILINILSNFRIVRKFLEFMKINSLLVSIPGLKCTVKHSIVMKNNSL